MKLENKTIWITGASSGIGECIALELANKSNTIIISARSVDKLKKLQIEIEKKGSKCIVAPLDLEDAESINKQADIILSDHNQIDLLLNNGGISQRSLAEETPIENDRKIMDVNFFGQIILTKKVLAQMIKNKRGHIAVTSSIVGKFGFPLRSAYAASKHALQGYFESLKIEQSVNNIKVSIIIPGRIKTNISLYAIDKDGKGQGKMDEGLDAGMDSFLAAKKIIKGLEKEKYEILVGRKELLMVFFRKYFKKEVFKIFTKENHK